MADCFDELFVYVHPVWQTITLLLMVVALSLGLRLRRERTLPWDPAVRARLVRRHLTVALTFLGMLTTGYGLGLNALLEHLGS